MPHAFGVFRFAVFVALALGRAAMTAASALLSSAMLSSAGTGRGAYKESRAPQNRYPIGGLEYELRNLSTR
jgi:hypothetical protein